MKVILLASKYTLTKVSNLELIGDRVVELFLSMQLFEDDMYIISPWIRNFKHSVYGKLVPQSMLISPSPSLLDLLRYAKVNNIIVKILVKPIHELFNSEYIRTLTSVTIRDPLNPAISLLINQTLAQMHMLRLLYNIIREKLAEVRFLERLHTKIMATRKFAIIGSSNYTESGLNYNVETNIFVSGTDAEQIYELAKNMWEASQPVSVYKEKRFSIWEDKYNELLEALKIYKRSVKNPDPRLIDLMNLLTRIIAI